MSAPERQAVTIVPGFQATCRLVALPAASITLERLSVATIAQARTAVTLSGTAENVPSGTAYAIRWLVTSGDRVRRVGVAEPPPFEVGPDGRFSLDLSVDVFELELFGEGTLGVQLKSAFPQCAPVSLEKAISWKNTLSVSLQGEGTAIGSVRTWAVETQGVLADCEVRVDVFEADSGKDEQTGTTNFSRPFTWSASDRKPQAWRIGCHEAEGPVVFDYADDAEVGDYEFGYTASVRPPGGAGVWYPITSNPALLSSPRPTLESISLVEERIESASLTFQWLDPTLWGEENIRPAAFRLKGRVKGFKEGLAVRFGVALWVRKEAGASLEQFIPTADKLKEFELRADGSFDVEVVNFSKFALAYKRFHEDLTDKSATWEFHAWLWCLSDKAAPFSWLIDLPKGCGARPWKKDSIALDAEKWNCGAVIRGETLAGSEGPVLALGNSGEAVEELQVRLAGFGGVMPSGEFDEATQAAVERFQDEYMDVQPTGVVDAATIKAIKTFGETYTVFDKGALKCHDGSKVCACGGFGKGIHKGDYTSSSKLERYHRYEYPGIHRLVLWAVKGIMFHMESATDPALSLGTFSCAYRCSLNNARAGRTTTNHMGKAADLLIYTRASDEAAWARPSSTAERKKLSDAVRDLFCKHARAQVRWGERDRLSLEPGTESYPDEYTSPTWVHVDAREFSAEYLADRFFCTDEATLNGAPLSDYDFS